VIDLLPSGFQGGYVNAIRGTKQAGTVSTDGTLAGDHAAVWQGTTASFQDLTPPGYNSANIRGISGADMVGFAIPNSEVPSSDFPHLHAVRWVAGKATDLNPDIAPYSFATNSDGHTQVGFYRNTVDDDAFACMWSGTKKSFVNLHALLPAEFKFSAATGVNGKVITGWAERADSSTVGVIWRLP
jgi:hypothetical protein